MFSRLFGINHPIKNESTEKAQESMLSLLFNKGNVSGLDRILLCGPISSGKTSLLFELALSFADEEKQVLYICPKKFSKLPLLTHGRSQPTSETLKYIQMVYSETRAEYLNYMASIHFSTTKRFSCIIVDGLDAYFTSTMKNEDVSLIARVFALTVDAFHFQMSKLAQTTETGRGMLVMSITTPSGATSIPRQQFYERWMHCILQTQEKEANLFEMSLLPSNSCCVASRANITYTITDQVIRVQDIENSSQSGTTASE